MFWVSLVILPAAGWVWALVLLVVQAEYLALSAGSRWVMAARVHREAFAKSSPINAPWAGSSWQSRVWDVLLPLQRLRPGLWPGD